MHSEIWPVTIVGVGAIGERIAKEIAQFHNFKQDNMILTLIDKDIYAPRNIERQTFDALGNKAEVKTQELRSRYPHITIEPVAKYLNKKNVQAYVNEKMVVFSCVDNHVSRAILSQYCENLNNIVLINTGNEYYHGDAYMHMKIDGRTITKAFHEVHPEILTSQERHPDDIGCEEAIVSAPQLGFVNYLVAGLALQLYYAWLQRDCWKQHPQLKLLCPPANEIYADIIALKTRPVLHASLKN